MATRHPMTPEARRVRARLGEASRRYGQDHEETRAVRAEWEAERWISAIAVALDAPRPPLNQDQETRLATALREALAKVSAS